MREYPQFRLRMPPDLKDQIQAEADKNGRSMNAEIVHRLEHSIGSEISSRSVAIQDPVRELINRLYTIKTGRQLLEEHTSETSGPLQKYLAELERELQDFIEATIQQINNVKPPDA